MHLWKVQGLQRWRGRKVVHGFSRHRARTFSPAKAVDYFSKPRTVRPVCWEKWYQGDGAGFSSVHGAKPAVQNQEHDA